MSEEGPELPFASVYDVPREQMFEESSVFAVGVKVPVHVTPPFADDIVARAPFAQVTSSALANPTTASLNVSVSVGVSPLFIATSLNEKEETVGWVFSTSISPESAVVSAAAPAFPATSSNVQEKVTSPLVSPSATKILAVQDVPDPL